MQENQATETNLPMKAEEVSLPEPQKEASEQVENAEINQSEASGSIHTDEKTKAQTAKKDGRATLTEEFRTLGELIPGSDIREMDAEGWDALMNGESLILAYLASERRKRLADETNKRNLASTPGEVKPASPGLYSIDEIKQMDRGSVRRNLDKVLRSLERKK